MAITATLLTSGHSDTDATSYNTASITPSANKLILLSVYNRRSGASATPTVSGCGLTWVEVVAQASSDTFLRGTIFRALGASPTTGALTISYGANTQILCNWAVTEFDNIDTTGTDGSGAIVQSAGNRDEGATNSGLTITLSAFGSANNATYGSVRAGNAITPGSGFTELCEESSTDTPYFQAQWKNSADTTIDWTWSSIDSYAIGVACEIKYYEAPTTNTSNFFNFIS